MSKSIRQSTFTALFFVIVTALAIYSFVHKDLNLTLSSYPGYVVIQDELTRLGFYNRPLSTGIFIGFMLSLFSVYVWVTSKMTENERHKYVPILITIVLILLFAYPAFSHDVFNYMFDARIVTRYGASPYFFKALDFPLDPWIRFMRWTHRYYPYGPGWLLLTLIPSWLGMGKFVMTLLLFKFTFAAFYLANCIVIYKITLKVRPESAYRNVAFFALNPLVITESLVSPHNEVMMLTFVLAALYFMLAKGKDGLSFVFLALSISIKFISIALLPLYFFSKKPAHVLRISWFLWLVTLIPLVYMRELYAWYLIPLVGLAALISDWRWVKVTTMALSLAAVVRYAPFLYYGDYGIFTRRAELWLASGVFLFVLVLSNRLWQKD